MSASQGGDLLEGGFIEPAAHRLSLVVAQVGVFPVGVADLQVGAFGGADADGEDLDPVPGDLPRGLDGFSAEVLAVGQKDDSLHIAFNGKCLGCFFKGAAEVAAATGETTRADRIQAFPEGGVVEGGGRLEEGLSSVGDEPDPVAFEALDEVEHSELGAGQAGGPQVGGEHAF